MLPQPIMMDHMQQVQDLRNIKNMINFQIKSLER